jgi:hypothetical protein
VARTTYAIYERPRGYRRVFWSRGPLFESMEQARQRVELLQVVYNFQEFVVVAWRVGDEPLPLRLAPKRAASLSGGAEYKI